MTVGFRVEESTTHDFTRLFAHYTAHPKKRDPKWIARARKGMPVVDWLREMELDFSAGRGSLVFPMLRHFPDAVYVDPFEIPHWWPLYGSIDYGFWNPFCFLIHTVDPDGIKYCVYEHYHARRTIPWHAQEIKKHPWFNRLQAIYIDPSTKARTHQGRSDGGDSPQSTIDILTEHGIYATPSVPSRVARTQRLLNHFQLLRADVAEPFRLSKYRVFRTCPNLWSELLNLKTQELTGAQVVTKSAHEAPMKVNDHAFDAATYFLMMQPDPGTEPNPEQEAIRQRERTLDPNELWAWDAAHDAARRRQENRDGYSLP